MNINLSFFKRTFLTGAAIAAAVGGGSALFGQAGAIQNSQSTSSGLGFALTMNSDQGKLTQVSGTPNVCSSTTNGICRCPHMGMMCVRCWPTAIANSFCSRCDGDNDADDAFCACMQADSDICQTCLPNQASLCVWCPPNSSMGAPAMGAPCRIFDNNNSQGNSGIVTPQSSSSASASASVGADGTTSQTYLGTPPATGNDGSTDNSGGNTTGSDQTNPPSTTGCNGNPHMMIACKAPGNDTGCPYLEFCRAQ